MSGDYFYCEIGWNNHNSYNATYQIIIDDCKRASYVYMFGYFTCMHGVCYVLAVNTTDRDSMKSSLKTGNGIANTRPCKYVSIDFYQYLTEPSTIVALNATIDYMSDGSAVYYKSDLLVDIQNDDDVDDYLINVTIICTFSGHPRPQVKWFLNGLNISECIDTTNIVTEGNTSSLHITTTNPKSFFGSYQCVVDNEVGYASNTTRILPRGTYVHVVDKTIIYCMIMHRLEQPS